MSNRKKLLAISLPAFAVTGAAALLLSLPAHASTSGTTGPVVGPVIAQSHGAANPSSAPTASSSDAPKCAATALSLPKGYPVAPAVVQGDDTKSSSPLAGQRQATDYELHHAPWDATTGNLPACPNGPAN